MTILLDTNYLVRYLVNDIENLAQEAAKIIEGRNGSIFISALSVAEAVYILSRHYRNNKLSICDKLIHLLQYPNLKTENYVIPALQVFQEENISIYDSIIVSEAIQKNLALKTFDKKLQKVFKKYSPLRN